MVTRMDDGSFCLYCNRCKSELTRDDEAIEVSVEIRQLLRNIHHKDKYDFHLCSHCASVLTNFLDFENYD